MQTLGFKKESKNLTPTKMNYYEILGIKPNATKQEIWTAYNKKIESSDSTKDKIYRQAYMELTKERRKQKGVFKKNPKRRTKQTRSSSSPNKDYYGILGVSSDATTKDIIQAYNKKIGSSDLLKDKNKIKGYEEAYKTLVNRKRRIAYEIQRFSLRTTIKRAKAVYDNQNKSTKKGVKHFFTRNVYLPLKTFQIRHALKKGKKGHEKIIENFWRTEPVLATVIFAAAALVAGSAVGYTVQQFFAPTSPEPSQINPQHGNHLFIDQEPPQEERTITRERVVAANDTIWDYSMEDNMTVPEYSGFSSGDPNKIKPGEVVRCEIPINDVDIVTAKASLLGDDGKCPENVIQSYSEFCGISPDCLKMLNPDIDFSNLNGNELLNLAYCKGTPLYEGYKNGQYGLRGDRDEFVLLLPKTNPTDSKLGSPLRPTNEPVKSLVLTQNAVPIIGNK